VLELPEEWLLPDAVSATGFAPAASLGDAGRETLLARPRSFIAGLIFQFQRGDIRRAAIGAQGDARFCQRYNFRSHIVPSQENDPTIQT
jgi:hypothetical protein